MVLEVQVNRVRLETCLKYVDSQLWIELKIIICTYQVPLVLIKFNHVELYFTEYPLIESRDLKTVVSVLIIPADIIVTSLLENEPH